MTKHFFAWDLGATKCSAGIVEYDENSSTLVCKKNYTLKLTDADSLDNLIEQLETGLQFAMRDADAICIGAAGQFDGEYLLLENAYPYPMHFAKIAREQNWRSYAVIHDYAPIVCATFTSYMQQANNIKRLNTCPMQIHGRRVALGIGTGLGLKDGVMLENGDFWLGKNEIGHIGVTAPPLTEKHHLARHKELMQFLRDFDAASANQAITFEKILSGKGTVRLYQFFHPSDDIITPEEVGQKMCQGKADELLDTLAWYAGLLVGTVQLAFLPEGGVWITGGVALKNLKMFDRPDFAAGINASPAYAKQRENYALGVLCNQEHALIGCGYYASKKLLPALQQVGTLVA